MVGGRSAPELWQIYVDAFSRGVTERDATLLYAGRNTSAGSVDSDLRRGQPAPGLDQYARHGMQRCASAKCLRRNACTRHTSHWQCGQRTVSAQHMESRSRCGSDSRSPEMHRIEAWASSSITISSRVTERAGKLRTLCLQGILSLPIICSYPNSCLRPLTFYESCGLLYDALCHIRFLALCPICLSILPVGLFAPPLASDGMDVSIRDTRGT